jgi:hypothetical protein
MRQVFLNIHRAYHAILLRHGMTREKVEEWSQNADEGEFRNIPSLEVFFSLQLLIHYHQN